MNFTKTTEYALRILSLMATEDMKLFPADYFHRRLDIPQRYLRRLMTNLTKSGLIESCRGRNGGFVFARNPSSIYIADIIIAVEGSVSINPCIMGFKECALQNPCPMHNLWEETKNSMMEILTTVSLADMKKTKQ